MSTRPPIAALSAPGDDALSKADGEGYPDREEVVAWTERVKSVVLHQRDRGAAARRAARAGRAAAAAADARWACPRASIAEARGRELRGAAARGAAAASREDVEAAFEGDPAAKSFAEIVVAYPSIDAIAIYRLAHELVKLGVPQIPRIMAEHAHDRTGHRHPPGRAASAGASSSTTAPVS